MLISHEIGSNLVFKNPGIQPRYIAYLEITSGQKYQFVTAIFLAQLMGVAH